jgi:hypothetical protein
MCLRAPCFLRLSRPLQKCGSVRPDGGSRPHGRRPRPSRRGAPPRPPWPGDRQGLWRSPIAPWTVFSLISGETRISGLHGALQTCPVGSGRPGAARFTAACAVKPPPTGLARRDTDRKRPRVRFTGACAVKRPLTGLGRRDTGRKRVRVRFSAALRGKAPPNRTHFDQSGPEPDWRSVPPRPSHPTARGFAGFGRVAPQPTR